MADMYFERQKGALCSKYAANMILGYPCITEKMLDATSKELTDRPSNITTQGEPGYQYAAGGDYEVQTVIATLSKVAGVKPEEFMTKRLNLTSDEEWEVAGYLAYPESNRHVIAIKHVQRDLFLMDSLAKGPMPIAKTDALEMYLRPPSHLCCRILRRAAPSGGSPGNKRNAEDTKGQSGSQEATAEPPEKKRKIAKKAKAKATPTERGEATAAGNSEAPPDPQGGNYKGEKREAEKTTASGELHAPAGTPPSSTQDKGNLRPRDCFNYAATYFKANQDATLADACAAIAAK